MARCSRNLYEVRTISDWAMCGTGTCKEAAMELDHYWVLSRTDILEDKNLSADVMTMNNFCKSPVGCQNSGTWDDPLQPTKSGKYSIVLEH